MVGLPILFIIIIHPDETRKSKGLFTVIHTYHASLGLDQNVSHHFEFYPRHVQKYANSEILYQEQPCKCFQVISEKAIGHLDVSDDACKRSENLNVASESTMQPSIESNSVYEKQCEKSYVKFVPQVSEVVKL